MGKLKQWLCERYLPALAKGVLLEELDRLRRALTQEQQHSAQLHAYISGMEKALRLSARKEVKPVGRNDTSAV